MSTPMEKIASLPPSSQIRVLATTLEKLAVERDMYRVHAENLTKEAELDSLYRRIQEAGQDHWASREDALQDLRKISADGKLEALKLSVDLSFPGAIGKVASGLVSMTEGGTKAEGKPDLGASRQRFLDVVMGGDLGD